MRGVQKDMYVDLYFCNFVLDILVFIGPKTRGTLSSLYIELFLSPEGEDHHFPSFSLIPISISFFSYVLSYYIDRNKKVGISTCSYIYIYIYIYSMHANLRLKVFSNQVYFPSIYTYL